jgi:hypothetical protein
VASAQSDTIAHADTMYNAYTSARTSHSYFIIALESFSQGIVFPVSSIPWGMASRLKIWTDRIDCPRATSAVVAFNGEKYLATDPMGRFADGMAVRECESCLDHVLSSNTVTAHEASFFFVASA